MSSTRSNMQADYTKGEPHPDQSPNASMHPCTHATHRHTSVTYLDGRLDGLNLHHGGLPHAIGLHVHDLAGMAIDTPGLVGLGVRRMLGLVSQESV